MRVERQRLGGFGSLPRIALACLALSAAPMPPEVPNRCKPTVLREDVVEKTEAIVDAGELVHPKGLVGPTGFDFNDTQLGVVRTKDGRGYMFFGSDGSCHLQCNRPLERDGSITRTVGTLYDPLGKAAPEETVLPGNRLPGYILYVGGGPVYRVPEGMPGKGNLLLVYHAERATYLPGYRYPDCDSTGFCNSHQNGIYSWLGLARSTDEGRTWSDLGLVIQANQPYNPQQLFDVGDGALVVGADPWKPNLKYFYLYFPDLLRSTTSPGGVATNMSVARVPYTSFLTAMAGGRNLPAFRKYNQGAWTSPGLGGASSDLLPGSTQLGAQSGAHYDMEIARSEDGTRYIGIFGNTHTVKYAESIDGLAWSSATTLTPHIDQNTQVAVYATPVGMGADPGAIGDRFYIYYIFQQYYGSNAGWISAQLRRLDVTCTGAGASASPGRL